MSKKPPYAMERRRRKLITRDRRHSRTTPPSDEGTLHREVLTAALFDKKSQMLRN